MHGMPLSILGVTTELSNSGMRMWPDEDKTVSWCAMIREILASKRLTSGEASKLAGRLQWATQFVFKRLGRAMLRPIFKSGSTFDISLLHIRVGRQVRARTSVINDELETALEWWLHVLAARICQKREWKEDTTPPLQLYCDARSSPPHLAAVLVG